MRQNVSLQGRHERNIPPLAPFLLISEDLFLLDFPAIAVFTAHLSEGIKTPNGANPAKKGPFWAIFALPPWL